MSLPYTQAVMPNGEIRSIRYNPNTDWASYSTSHKGKKVVLKGYWGLDLDNQISFFPLHSKKHKKVFC